MAELSSRTDHTALEFHVNVQPKIFTTWPCTGNGSHLCCRHPVLSPTAPSRLDASALMWQTQQESTLKSCQDLITGLRMRGRAPPEKGLLFVMKQPSWVSWGHSEFGWNCYLWALYNLGGALKMMHDNMIQPHEHAGTIWCSRRILRFKSLKQRQRSSVYRQTVPFFTHFIKDSHFD